MAELIAVVKKSVSWLHHGVDGKDIAGVEQAAPSTHSVSAADARRKDAVKYQGHGTRCPESLSIRDQS